MYYYFFFLNKLPVTLWTFVCYNYKSKEYRGHDFSASVVPYYKIYTNYSRIVFMFIDETVLLEYTLDGLV